MENHKISGKQVSQWNQQSIVNSSTQNNSTEKVKLEKNSKTALALYPLAATSGAPLSFYTLGYIIYIRLHLVPLEGALWSSGYPVIRLEEDGSTACNRWTNYRDICHWRRLVENI